jgi:hypothetical protein
MKPLLLLDVDGVLNPWAAPNRPGEFVEYRFRLTSWGRKRLRVWLNPRHGAELSMLAERAGVELVWATTWAQRANVLVGPVIGLPELPVIEFAGPHSDGLPSWKFPAVARYGYGRPLAWLDDDFSLFPEARAAFLAKRNADGLATELVSVDPRVGMTGEDLAAVERWVAGIG